GSAARHRGEHHKLKQLCRQVRHAVDDALASECDDPLLHNLMVCSVQPAPHAGRLRIILESTWPDDTFNADEALARLNALKGLLRAEVASAINRRRVPELTFYVLTPGEIQR
ncbi:MAG: ribosome-binding factor A, partial [Myxococcota bacterium]